MPTGLIRDFGAFVLVFAATLALATAFYIVFECPLRRAIAIKHHNHDVEA